MNNDQQDQQNKRKRKVPPKLDANVAQWLQYIGEIHPVVIDLGLERVQIVADRLNLLKLNSTVIMIAGTNGKGSCVKMLESLYLTAGYSVAASTSPHLVNFNERLRVCGQEVSDHVLLQGFRAVEAARQQVSLSYFEFTTLAILYCVQQVEADITLLEVGLGGRLDAVNVVEPDIAVITNIDLDHMSYLGDTREKIGFEKAGIFRQGKPVVCGDPDPPQSIYQVASDIGSTLYCLNKEFSYKSNVNDWEFSGPNHCWLELPTPHLKKQNIATSLAVAQLLFPRFSLNQVNVVRAIGSTRLAGRFELPDFPKRCVLDVAHNPQSMRWLVTQLQSLQIVGRILLVMGMLKDKSIDECLPCLLPMVEDWYVASIDDPRGATGEQLLQHLQALQVKNCYTFGSVSQAFEEALEQQGPDDWVVVCGSFHTVGAVKQFLEQYQEELQ